MTGFYYYDPARKLWSWHINYLYVQVASGTCINKKEMEKVIRRNAHVNWIKT